MLPHPAVPTAGARFDDLVDGRAWICPAPHTVLSTSLAAEVPEVLDAVHTATANGSWAFGFVAYEAAPGLDPLCVVQAGPAGSPLAWFGVCAAPTLAPAVAWTDVAPDAALSAGRWVQEWSVEEYGRQLASIKAAIAAGDTYQCNLTVRLRGRIAGSLQATYAALALGQRGRYGSFLDTGSSAVLSASPELFFDWSGDTITTRPMKGTAPRGRTTAEDRDAVMALQADPKERAENIMITDLLRNDVSRIAVPGSVTASALGTAERYETLWTLTSTVSAQTPPDLTLTEIFRKLFPSGSVTGAPKYPSMRLLSTLETSPRGVYCGAVGLVAPPGNEFRARFNVAIRTLTVELPSGRATYGTGSGITWGSRPEAEGAELMTKAAILWEPPTDFELLETMGFCRPVDASVLEGVRHLDRHLRRMADSAAYFGFAFDLATVRGEMRCALRSSPLQRARVRLRLSREGVVSASITVGPDPAVAPVRLAVDTHPVDSGSRWLFHKTTHRAVYEAAAARHPDADDVLLVTAGGEITETTVGNIAVRLDGTWFTPPIAVGCLPGIERAVRLERGELVERVLSVEDVERCEELAIVSSLRGWRPATHTLGRHTVPAGSRHGGSPFA